MAWPGGRGGGGGSNDTRHPPTDQNGTAFWQGCSASGGPGLGLGSSRFQRWSRPLSMLVQSSNPYASALSVQSRLVCLSGPSRLADCLQNRNWGDGFADKRGFAPAIGALFPDDFPRLANSPIHHPLRTWVPFLLPLALQVTRGTYLDSLYILSRLSTPPSTPERVYHSSTLSLVPSSSSNPLTPLRSVPVSFLSFCFRAFWPLLMRSHPSGQCRRWRLVQGRG